MVENKIISIDLGGTYLRSAIVRNGKVYSYTKKKTPKTKEALLKEIVDSISSLMSKDVKAIGIGSPGPLEKGIIKNPPNIPLKNFNLKKYLEEKFHKTVVIENDAKCVALAELKFGCKKKNFFILTLGTGIGGGIIIDSKIYSGQGMGAELGHLVIDNGKYLESLWKEKRDNISILIKKKKNKELDKLAEYFGQAIGSLINVFDPETVILMGGVRETGNIFLNMVVKHTKKYCILPRKISIKWSKLDHPGILGASLLVK